LAQSILQPLGHKFEVPSSHRLNEVARHPSHHAAEGEFALPIHLGRLSGPSYVKLQIQLKLTARHDTLAAVQDTAGAHGLEQLHSKVGMAADLRDGNGDLQAEVGRVLHRHRFEIGE